MLSDPTLAGSSTAPGSPVTYSPGIPSFPAALVMSMIEFSTVAGASPSRRFLASVAAGLEADAVDRGVSLARAAEDLLERATQVVGLGKVDGLAAEAGGLGKPVGLHVADDHDGSAEQVRRGGRGQADGACPAM